MQEEVPDTVITLTEAIAAQSLFGGQGFKKCQCNPGENQCQTNSCKCFKSKVKCKSSKI